MIDIEMTEVFEDWFNGLRDIRAKARIDAPLTVIAETGHFGDCKPIAGSKVSELRFHFGPGYRVYFMYRGDTIVLLLSGGDKDSQTRDIRKAIALSEEA